MEARLSAVLAEYIDYDTMQGHLIWIPITNLVSLQQSLPVRCVQPVESLRASFAENLELVAASYARLTL